MDYKNSGEAIVTEQKSYWKIGLLLFSLVLITFTIVGYYNNKNFIFGLFNQPKEIESPLKSYGLATISEDSSTPAGYLVYESQAIGTGSSTGSQFTYNIETGDTQENYFSLLKSSIEISTSTSLALTDQSQELTTNFWQPILFDISNQSIKVLPNLRGYNVQDLALSPDKKKYSYSYQSDTVITSDNRVLTDWNIAVHTFDSDELVVLNGAAKATWVEDTNSFVFLQSDGLYRYDIDTGVSTLVSTTHAPYSISDDVAIAPDGQQLLLTKPSLNLISLMRYANSQLIETGRIVGIDTGYSSPYFSPDSLFYTVVASTFTIDTGSTEPIVENVKKRLEIRSTINQKTLKELDLTNQNKVEITNWQK